MAGERPVVVPAQHRPQQVVQQPRVVLVHDLLCLLQHLLVQDVSFPVVKALPVYESAQLQNDNGYRISLADVLVDTFVDPFPHCSELLRRYFSLQLQ